MSDKIIKLRKDGLPLRAIAAECDLSYSGTRKVLRRNGVSTAAKGAAHRYMDPDHAIRVYGCSPDEVRAIQAGKILSERGSPAYLYIGQRKRYRNTVGWDFTLATWWELWKPHWKKRISKRLVLLPIDETKAVGPGNAHITNRSELNKLMWKTRKKRKH